MSKPRILYVCQEIFPYVEGQMGELCRELSGSMAEQGFEIRTFMPRYGCINERRNQLHEVIRLSGMNLVIGQADHQLIIKVASIPTARVQIYFIDNDDYFARKYMLRDAAGWFGDNDERAIFFARGVLETVRKLRWSPEVVHCHGWFAGVIAIYLRYVLGGDALFGGVKIVTSLYDQPFEGELDPGFAGKLMDDGVGADVLEGLKEGTTYERLMRFIIDNSDGVIVAGDGGGLEEYAAQSGKPVLRHEQGNYLESYKEFYEGIL